MSCRRLSAPFVVADSSTNIVLYPTVWPCKNHAVVVDIAGLSREIYGKLTADFRSHWGDPGSSSRSYFCSPGARPRLTAAGRVSEETQTHRAGLIFAVRAQGPGSLLRAGSLRRPRLIEPVLSLQSGLMAQAHCCGPGL